MHSTSENIKFTPCNDANEIVNELFESLRSKYQDSLETSMRRSDSFLIQFNLCITNVIKEILNVVVCILTLQTG